MEETVTLVGRLMWLFLVFVQNTYQVGALKYMNVRKLQSKFFIVERKGSLEMNIEELWDGIELGGKHREAVLHMSFEAQECKRLYQLYEKDHNEFFEEVLKKEESGLWFLWLYSHMACEVYERYQAAGISEEIFWDTFRDICLWCENSEKEFGTLGLAVYEWFYRHIDMVLFRFGRLQFEKMEDETNIHIPQGEPLIWEECEKSIEAAIKFWGDDKRYVCHSWLLYPGLDEVLSEKSNIREFRKHFKVMRTDYNEREAEWRVFGKVLKNVVEYPEETSLQRRVKEYLLSGRSLGNGWGVLKEM